MSSAPPRRTPALEVVAFKRGPTGIPGTNGKGRSVYLYPGEVFASAEPRVISTILGSCVAVFLGDEVTRAGGSNHFLLPHLISGDSSSSRFGVVAMRVLLEKLLALGCEKRNLRAKVFGGASQFENASGRVPIGQLNVRLAIRILEDEGIPVVARETGGARGRKVIIHTDTGDVWVRQL
jgi:chemotaxis protein CheD